MPEFHAYAPMDMVLSMKDRGLLELTSDGWTTTGKADIIIQAALEEALK